MSVPFSASRRFRLNSYPVIALRRSFFSGLPRSLASIAMVIDAIASGAFEIYVPPWFAEIVAGKFQDPRAFLEGSAAWTAERVATLGQ